jgi:hypothetical protein
MTRPLIALLCLSLAPQAGAVHSKNAGPEKVELKFKLPPPKPLSPEEAMKAFQVEVSAIEFEQK